MICTSVKTYTAAPPQCPPLCVPVQGESNDTMCKWSLLDIGLANAPDDEEESIILSNASSHAVFFKVEDRFICVGQFQDRGVAIHAYNLTKKSANLQKPYGAQEYIEKVHMMQVADDVLRDFGLSV